MINKAGVAVVQKSNGKWYGLFVYQKSSNRWSFPKGSRNSQQETWQQCAKREMAEETGLYVIISDKNEDNHIQFSSNTAYYVFTPTYSQLKLINNRRTKDSKEIGDIRWMEIDETKYEFHASVSRLMVELNKIEYFKLPKMQKLDTRKFMDVCIRSRWTPTKFFTIKKHICNSNWR